MRGGLLIYTSKPLLSVIGATTRKEKSVDLLKSNGADQVFLDNGSIAEDVKKAGQYDKASSDISVSWYDCDVPTAGN